MNSPVKHLSYKIDQIDNTKEPRYCTDWRLQVNLPVEMKNGKPYYPRKRKKFKGHYREAQKAAMEFRDQLENELIVSGTINNSHYSLYDYCREFYSVKELRAELDPASLTRVRNALDNLMLNHQNVFIEAVTTNSLTKAMIALKNGSSCSKKKLAPATISKYVMYWNQMFEQACEEGLIQSNPAARIKKFKVPKPKKKALTCEEAKELYLKLNPRNRSEMGTLISLFAGLRQSEVLNLRWEDISFEDSNLTVTKSKTHAGLRVVPIIEELADALQIRKDFIKSQIEKYNSQQENQKLKLKFNERWFVCSDAISCERSNKSMLSKWWMRNKKRLNCSEYKFHDLRHTFATLLAESGAHPATMQKLLGHSTAKMSLEVYTHVHDENLAKAMEDFRSIIK